jgi:hypothetical protein
MNMANNKPLFSKANFIVNFPFELRKEKRWVRYFLKDKPEGGTAKIPLGNHSDPATWSSFDECVAALEPGKEQGIGYCFLGGEIHALDIDHCRNPKTGEICPEAMLLLSRLQSWAEYSVSGQGIHVFFKGNVRGKQLTETCLQYWNPKNSPRFFALTCDMVGEAFKAIKDVGDEFNYIFATARHISAKIREELKEVDYEQWAALPQEREPVEKQREKSKTKSRKLHPDFNLEDFLKFYGLEVDNVANNSVGKCYRLTSCPIKGEKHVGQNSTTTNFILSTDGGLGFHCQSTGCVEWSVAEVIKKLADDKEPYPGNIYVAEKKQPEVGLIYTLSSLDEVEETSLSWLWPGFLPDNQLVHFAGASSEGKSPVTLDIIARTTTGEEWPDGTSNPLGPRSVILMAGEDDMSDTVKPRLRVVGADMSKIKLFNVTAKRDDKETDLAAALDRDYQGLVDAARSLDDLALIVIDPITNYLGRQSMNKEEDIRGNISMPLKGLAQDKCACIITVGHLNKRDREATVLQRTMGAAAFTGVPRKVFLFGNDPEDDNKHAHIMTEVRDKQVSIQYKTKTVPDPEGIQKSPIIKVEWGKLVEADADAVVNAPKQREKTTSKEVQVLLKTLLRDGAKPTTDIEKAIKEAGIDCANWQRAAKRVAQSRQIKGKGKNAGWEWYLPTPEQAEFGGLATQHDSEEATA